MDKTEEYRLGPKTVPSEYEQKKMSYDVKGFRQSIPNTTTKAEKLQKQLRDEKRALVIVFPIDDWNSFGYRLLLPDLMTPFFEVPNDLEFPTWEAALEAGVKEALNHTKQ